MGLRDVDVARSIGAPLEVVSAKVDTQKGLHDFLDAHNSPAATMRLKRSLHAAPLLRSMPKSWRAEEHVAGLRIWAFAGQLRVAFLRDLPVDCVFITC
jgi:hypothetical protein